jgi:hypothetical protein
MKYLLPPNYNYVLAGLLSVIFPALVFLLFKIDVKHKIDVANLFAQIVMASAALFAFINYFERKNERRMKEALNLISFFRKEMITLQTELTDIVRRKEGSEFKFYRCELFDIESISTIIPSGEAFENASRIYNVKDAERKATELMNTLEEFSLCVLVNGLDSSPALKSIQAAFVEIVEHNILIVIYHRTVGTAPNVYSETLKLYDKWKRQINRDSPEVRLVKLRESLSTLKNKD